MIKNFINKYNLEYYEEVSLKKYNSYKLDVKAKYLIFPKNEKELKKIMEFVRKNKIKYLVLGNGSNIIFSCSYYDGIIIKLDRFNDLTIDDVKIKVGAGYSLVKLALDVANKGLSGLEFASAIPGLVGASVAMNAGAYNSSLADVVKSVRVLYPDGRIRTMRVKDMNFAYRFSFFKNNKEYIILSCKFKLVHGDKKEIIELMNRRRIRRLETQPLEYPSAGSVFRNPDGLYAGKLIEDAGLKGCKSGGAMVSLKHANFIINYDRATGDDIIKLINKIRNEVKKKFDIDLVLEQIIVN